MMKINQLLRFRPARALFIFVLMLVSSFSALAQVATDTPEMADGLRQSGKIYIVVAAIVIIVAGMLAYLISLDRKVSRLEREIKP